MRTTGLAGGLVGWLAGWPGSGRKLAGELAGRYWLGAWLLRIVNLGWDGVLRDRAGCDHQLVLSTWSSLAAPQHPHPPS